MREHIQLRMVLMYDNITVQLQINNIYQTLPISQIGKVLSCYI